MRTTWIGGSAATLRHALVLFLLAILAVASDLASGPVVNNGDFWRVARAARIELIAWEPLRDHYPIRQAQSGESQLQSSTLAWLVSGLRMAHTAMGIAEFRTLTSWLALNAIFAAGVGWLLLGVSIRQRVMLASISLAAYALFAFYFKSLFEEAVVLALLPWMLGGVTRAYAGSGWAVFVVTVSAMLAAKATMIFALPVGLFIVIDAEMRNRGRPAAVAGLGVTLVAAAAVPYVFIFGTGDTRMSENAYNRFYNGIGWSAQHVADWPAINFTARFRYSYAHLAELQSISAGYEPIAGKRFLGTSYYPTGRALADTPPPDSAGRHALLRALVEQGTVPKYLQYLAMHPTLLFDHLTSIWRITWSSEYQLEYLRTRLHAGVAWADRLTQLLNLPMRHLGAIFLLSGLALLLLATSLPSMLVVVFWFLGAPLFIVFGDGYSEFERHLAPYLILTPVVGLAILQARCATASKRQG